MIEYSTVTTEKELQQILNLQRKNLENALVKEDVQSQGFVTVRHDFAILSAMNTPYPHIIAKEEEELVGYTLVMLRSFGQEIPVLIPMFEKINALYYKGKLLQEETYFVMGQVCIDRAYRGQGLFTGMYHKMREEMADKFSYIITEVATRNTRSMAAHRKVGFETILEYGSEQEEEWAIVLWDWK